MRKYSSLFWYVALFGLIFFTDRATKFFALTNRFSRHKVNSFLSFNLMFNRGISWGMFDSQSSLIFLLISSFILLITLVMAAYAYTRFRSGHNIIGEVMVIAGSLSNILDRILYSGVIDFIVVSFGKWSWPVFNVADAFIVIGVCIISVGVWFQD